MLSKYKTSNKKLKLKGNFLGCSDLYLDQDTTKGSLPASIMSCLVTATSRSESSHLIRLETSPE